jgi:hypothetical protein
MKMYTWENQEMVQGLIKRVMITNPEYVEIVCKFSDEVKKFIME